MQADCTLDEAMTMLRDRALVSGQSVDEIADATIERRVRFGPST